VKAGLTRATQVLVGARPRRLLWLLGPTALALAIDLTLRGAQIAGFSLQGKAIYASSLLVSAALWALPLWVLGRRLSRARSPPNRGLAGVILGLWVLPLATFGFAGQVLYYRVFHAFMGRDTLRLGIALRGTVRGWFDAWGGPWLLAAMVATGLGVTFASAMAARRVFHDGPRDRRAPLLLVVTFAGALFCLWIDQVDSRFLQAATPDVCFAHSVVHAVRMAATGQWSRRQGVSLRTPAPLPPLTTSRSRRPNVLVVLTESVRADAVCSEPPSGCRDPFFDEVAPDRVPLGVLATQTPNTFSACALLWTGLVPTADFHAMHTAPVLWELAHSVGYATAYVSAQNPRYEDFGAFTQRAGIDVLVTGTDLGGMADEQIGAPDERAVDAMLRFVTGVREGTPYFAVLHLSNTHAPYRVDDALLPYLPQSADPLGNVDAFHNRYRDAVRLDQRTLAPLFRALRASAAWDDTAVVFLSDHGEQFREHGGLYHNHSLYEEDLRIPGFLVAGPSVLSDVERAALAAYAFRRTYMQDVHETLVDLLGLEDARQALPLATLIQGRSLLRPPSSEPAVLLATSTAVWEPDDARFGVEQGARKVLGGPAGPWACFDVGRDPREEWPKPARECDDLLAIARRELAGIASPE
jgi:hypothetical protein